MDERTQTWLGIAIILSAVWVTVVMLIDVKIKNDILKTALKVDGDLQLIRGYTGVAHADEGMGSGKMGTPDIPDVPGNLRNGHISGIHARLETPSFDSKDAAWAPFATGVVDG